MFAKGRTELVLSQLRWYANTYKYYCKVLPSACLYICQLTSQDLYILTLQNFLYVLPAAVAQSLSDDSVMRCVLMVL